MQNINSKIEQIKDGFYDKDLKKLPSQSQINSTPTIDKIGNNLLLLDNDPQSINNHPKNSNKVDQVEKINRFNNDSDDQYFSKQINKINNDSDDHDFPIYNFTNPESPTSHLDSPDK